jgi:hypothetical protein
MYTKLCKVGSALTLLNDGRFVLHTLSQNYGKIACTNSKKVATLDSFLYTVFEKRERNVITLVEKLPVMLRSCLMHCCKNDEEVLLSRKKSPILKTSLLHH